METTGYFRVFPGEEEDQLQERLRQLDRDRVAERLYKKDHTVFADDPAEISNRMGWLDSPGVMKQAIPEIQRFVADAGESGFNQVLLLGMGGSSLAPLMFAETFEVSPGHLSLSVLDSTDPAAVAQAAAAIDPARTLFIVSTKSGGTVETLSLFKYFFNLTAAEMGEEKAGSHFAAITDPGSSLEKLAADLKFRKVFLNDPDIGGRFSALSFFGMVPAALMGIDIGALLDSADTMLKSDSGVRLGNLMGTYSLEGVDKLTLLISPSISTFGAWAEQLVAESTGKEGRGILPVDGEETGDLRVYGDDRLFVYIRLAGDIAHDEVFEALVEDSYPGAVMELGSLEELGGEFMRWEIATAVAGHVLGINPFDQPNVESAKVQSRAMLDAYINSGSLPSIEPSMENKTLAVYGDTGADNPGEVLTGLLDQAAPGDYAAIQAYLDYGDQTDEALAVLRRAIRDRYRLAVTVGYGPRFLHSTGQLHKGDGGNGIFIQLTADDTEDIPIPDEAGSEASSVTFGVLKASQAMGDMAALEESGRRVVRLHLKGGNIPAAINKLAALI
jgi:glucose-6-phosphate isomerase